MSHRPTFVSLFSGIGGIDLGLERAGMRCVAQVEIDPFCRRVLAKHWSDVPRFEDVRQVNGDTFRGTRVDVLAGGFPCQDVSHAGARVGIDGPRSGLWSEYARLIRELRPRFVLVENVPGLLDGGLGRVLGDLAVFGYDAEWDCLPAAAFGAPHLRWRVLLVGWPQEPTADTERRGLEGRVLRRPEPPAVEPSAVRRTSLGTDVGAAWPTEPGEGWLDDGLPSDVAEFTSRAYGNAVVPDVAEWIGRRIIAHGWGERAG